MGAAVESTALADRTTGCVDLSLGFGLATGTSGCGAGSDAGVALATGNGVGSGDAVGSFAEGVGAASEDFAVATGDNFGVRRPGTIIGDADASDMLTCPVTLCGVGAAL